MLNILRSSALLILLACALPTQAIAQTYAITPDPLKVHPSGQAFATFSTGVVYSQDRSFTVTSTRTDIASVPNSFVIPAGQSGGQIQVTGLGPGQAEITVYDGATALASTTVVVSPLTLLPDPLLLQTNAFADMSVDISPPAPAGGLVVYLTTSSSVVTLEASVIAIPQGASSATFAVAAGDVAGLAQITASSGIGSDTAAVSVTAGASRTLTLSPDPLTMVQNSTATMTLTLSESAPTGGLTVSLSVASGLVTVPVNVTVPAGDSAATFQVVSGANVGADQVIASATNWIGDAAAVTVTLDQSEANCRMRSRDAAHAGREYAKAAGKVGRACKSGGGAACTQALQLAGDAYATLGSAHAAMLAACQ